ncbi:glycoside hydrolase family 18 protein [Oceanispirochaeta crateris]|uniref:chitinase n=1 Tax=Oceanispirochaeta crateris TaxID=2518645 RepID=A0A5C1QG45_9SPIO|nr:glycoside hydrolase family 18 protein [Oceanispirochaeta crateris]QEN07143.1 glycoside hydrolase family 18 protein [Oceanispirochaeta crateris]
MNFFKPIIPIFFLISQILLIPSVQGQSSVKLETYLPSYRMKQLFPQDFSGRTAWYRMHPFARGIDFSKSQTLPANYNFSRGEFILNHFDEVYFFSLQIPPNGDPFIPVDMVDQLTYLKRFSTLKNANLNLCISGSSSDFIPMLRDETKKDLFLRELSNLLDEYQLQGIDLDWEFPGNDQEKEFYMDFLTDLRDLSETKQKSLSIAVSRFRSLPDEAYQLPDKIHLMTYDFYGRHSTLESTREALEYMIARYDIPPEKLWMGIPYYGRIFDGYSPDYWKKSQSYKEIVRQNSLLAHEDEAQGYYFNGADTVSKKTELGKELGLGGFFVWEIGQDSLSEKSLTLTLFESLQ